MNALTGLKMVRGMAGVASAAGALDPTLPSVMAAKRLWLGKKNALPMLGASLATRAVIIGVGLSIAGYRGKQMLWGSLAGSAMIEAYVLTWTYNQVAAGKMMGCPQPVPPPNPPEQMAGFQGGTMAGLYGGSS